MKKWMFVTILVSLVLVLTACGSSQNLKASASSTSSLSLEGQLLVGTFKLENTSLAVTSEQAATLIPLWEALQSLASSNSAASQEVDAVVSQIESSMSKQQVSRITTMKLTQQDLAATAIDTGSVSTTDSSGSSVKTSAAQLSAGSRDPGAGNPPGDMGAGMGGVSDVQIVSQSQVGTSQAVSTPSTVATNQVPAAMIKALLSLLQKKVG
ncbi:MAG: hypothetical protein ABSA01_07135 [Anaerolineales bacterium]|jgi:hypothetical protein